MRFGRRAFIKGAMATVIAAAATPHLPVQGGLFPPAGKVLPPAAEPKIFPSAVAPQAPPDEYTLSVEKLREVVRTLREGESRPIGEIGRLYGVRFVEGYYTAVLHPATADDLIRRGYIWPE